MRRWAELASALTLLTRLPAWRLARTHPPQAECVWAYPLAGLVVGGIGAGVLWAMMRAGFSQPLAALGALAVSVLLTGGLHEDGLADTADGFGGGATRERKLAIMRDSRIGSYGALALVFSVALRAVPLATAPRPALLLVLSAVLGRGAMLLPLLLLPPARADGLGAPLVATRPARLLSGLALAAWPAWFAPGAALGALAAGLGCTLLARRQIGGFTGDVLGATEQAAEIVSLALLARG